MARCLIIGCGCRGTELGLALATRGHAVRGTTRDHRRVEKLARAGIEPVLGDPDRVATLARAFEHVTVACVLLGSAIGRAEDLGALHSTRLEMLLGRMLDSTVRGIVYEASGSVSSAALTAGARIVKSACDGAATPYALLRAEPRDHGGWLEEASAVTTGLLEVR